MKTTPATRGRSTDRPGARRRPGAAPPHTRASGSRSAALCLPPACTLAATEQLQRRLIPLARKSGPVRLEVGAIERIDTACMQLLAAFLHERRASGRAVQLTGESAVFAEAVRLLGLGPLLAAAADLAVR
jgi:ABC-type transporter Mla MlaB component